MSYFTAMKYVAYCDILGFSNTVLSDFENTVSLYKEFSKSVGMSSLVLGDTTMSIYSDSIIIVGQELPNVLFAVKQLYWFALTHGWLIRGGVAFGKHWEESEGRNLFVVSEALVKAATIEKNVKLPIIKVSDEIRSDLINWVPVSDDILDAHLLYFDNTAFVNPFNRYWFNSAGINLMKLLEKHPSHSEKYLWFLSLMDAVSRQEALYPEEILVQLNELAKELDDES